VTAGLTPAYRLRLGRKVVDTAGEPRASTLTALDISLDLDVPADAFTLTLGAVGSFRPAKGDMAEIALGYAGEAPEAVMSGTVARVESGLTEIRVSGASAAGRLLRTALDRTFEGVSAGDIVRELARAGGVEITRAEDGTHFPAYVIDSRRSAWHHLRELADLCGFDLWIGRDGKLVFERFAGGRTAHVLEFRKHLLALEVLRREPGAARVEAIGESPASARGEKTWGWLTHDFGAARGTAGEGDPVRRLVRPALRTHQAAQTAATALQRTLARNALTGRALTVGRPQVRLGDAIRLRGLADESLNTFFQVRRVRHRLTKADGFTTEIGFRSIETQGVTL
jgi:phage protein D